MSTPLSDIFNKTTAASDAAYRGLLPKSAWEYAKTGLWAAGRFTWGLAKKVASTAWVGTKAVAFSIPPALKSLAYGVKTVAWDLPTAAYYQYHQDKPATDAARQQAREDFADAGEQFVQAVYTGASTAYEGMKSIAEDPETSVMKDGEEALLNTAKVVSIGVAETVKAVKASSTVRELGTRFSQLEAQTVQTAHDLYAALPSKDSLCSFLPGFAASQPGPINQGAIEVVRKAHRAMVGG